MSARACNGGASRGGARPADVLVFGGTTEGRLLVERLCAHPHVRAVACTATDYGACLLGPHPNLQVVAQHLDEPEMERLMRSRPFVCAVDATHPYAVEVSRNIAEAARACGLESLRVVREGEPEGPWTGASTPSQAAQLAAGFAAGHTGNILLTTGSKDLQVYTAAVPDFRERLFVRVLPSTASLQKALDAGVPSSRIIAMQGPFSYELNRALIHDLGIACLVTKASGAAGGFPEKVRAAMDAGIALIVVHRPVKEEGLDLEGACAYVEGLLGAPNDGAGLRRATSSRRIPEREER